MDISQFKAGVNIKQPTGYQCFMPETINHLFVWSDPELNMLLEQATLQLGALNSFSRFVPNIDLFIRLHVVKEATESSRIEGTQTNMEDALVAQSELEPEKRDDWQEVVNYIAAMNHGVARLEKLPISSRLLKECHRLLLNQVRGEHKQPGEFRTSQNWIGGSSPANAVFVPPVHQELGRLMGDLENFLHNDAVNVPHLVRIAIAHYQFETIHPFLDGNGRIGRLLITLYLIENKILEKPVLYLSDFFEKYKAVYYDRLTAVRNENRLGAWVKFFLEAVAKTCAHAVGSLQDMIALKEDCESRRIMHLGKKIPRAKAFLDYLYTQPVVTAADVARRLEISNVSAYKLIDDFLKAKILEETTGFKRNRWFVFREYLAIYHS